MSSEQAAGKTVRQRVDLVDGPERRIVLGMMSVFSGGFRQPHILHLL